MSGLEPMAVLAIGSTIAGTATSVVGRQMRGREEARAAELEQQQFERRERVISETADIQEQTTRTAAAQDEARRREELTSSLETIMAVRAGRGVGMNSPTGEAIFGSAIEGGEGDIVTQRTNFANRIQTQRLAADLEIENARASGELARRRRRSSLISADVGSLGDIFSAGARAASIGSGRVGRY